MLDGGGEGKDISKLESDGSTETVLEAPENSDLYPKLVGGVWKAKETGNLDDPDNLVAKHLVNDLHYYLKKDGKWFLTAKGSRELLEQERETRDYTRKMSAARLKKPSKKTELGNIEVKVESKKDNLTEGRRMFTILLQDRLNELTAKTGFFCVVELTPGDNQKKPDRCKVEFFSNVGGISVGKLGNINIRKSDLEFLSSAGGIKSAVVDTAYAAVNRYFVDKYK
jgi:hypothetical protein